MPSCGVFVSVCLSRSWTVSKRVKISSEIFSLSGSHTILVFPYQTGWQYSNGNPLMGASNAGGVDKNRDSEPICLSPVDDGHYLANCKNYIAGRILWVIYCVWLWPPSATHRSPSPWFFSASATKRALALYTITIDRMYDSKAWRYAEDNRQNRIVCTSKYQAEVTNNKKLRLKYCTIDATKLTTDRHEASRGLFVTAELLVYLTAKHFL